MNFINKFLNLIFPAFCKVCNKPLTSTEILVCNECIKKLPFLKSYCPNCGTPIPESLKNYTSYKDLDFCSYCYKQNFYFDKTFPVFYYREPLSKWLISIKFGKDFSLGYSLGKFIRKLLKNLPKVDLVVPIPLSSERLKERGFNQSLLIAWGFLGKRPHQHILKRWKNTRPQTELSQKDRWKNVKNAFKADISVKNKNVLLIDDVMTTGATLNEAAKSLKKAGAKKVYVLIVAKNPLN